MQSLRRVLHRTGRRGWRCPMLRVTQQAAAPQVWQVAQRSKFSRRKTKMLDEQYQNNVPRFAGVSRLKLRNLRRSRLHVPLNYDLVLGKMRPEDVENLAVYSEEPVLSQHTAEDIGSWIPVERQKLDMMPKTLFRPLNMHCNYVSEHMMLRPWMWEYMKDLEFFSDNDSFDMRRPPAPIKYPIGDVVGVTGPKGIGKSICLTHAAMYGYQNDWLVVYTAGREFAWEGLGLLEDSPHHPGYMDQTRLSQAWLRRFLKTHSRQLMQIRLKNTQGIEYMDEVEGWREHLEEQQTNRLNGNENAGTTQSATATETQGAGDEIVVEGAAATAEELANATEVVRPPAPTGVGRTMHPLRPLKASALGADRDAAPADDFETTLFDLCVVGAYARPRAAQVFYDVCTQLRLCTEFPVMVLIDDRNHWDTKSFFYNLDGRTRIPAQRLSMVHAFKKLQQKGLHNGVVMFSTTTANTMKYAGDYLGTATKVIEPDEYSDEELANALQHYIGKGVCYAKFTPELFHHCKAMTGACPREVMRYAFLM